MAVEVEPYARFALARISAAWMIHLLREVPTGMADAISRASIGEARALIEVDRVTPSTGLRPAPTLRPPRGIYAAAGNAADTTASAKSGGTAFPIARICAVFVSGLPFTTGSST